MLRIKHERLRRGWIQVDLAYHSRVPVADVSRIETGRLRPYDSQITKLATALGVGPTELLQEVAEIECAALSNQAGTPCDAAIRLERDGTIHASKTAR